MTKQAAAHVLCKLDVPLLLPEVDQIATITCHAPAQCSSVALASRATNKDSRTPLHLAAMGGHAGAAKLLLAAGAATQVKDKVGHHEIPAFMLPCLHQVRA